MKRDLSGSYGGCHAVHDPALGTLDKPGRRSVHRRQPARGVSGGKLLEGYLYRLAGMDIRSYENGFNSSSMAATYSAKANLNAEEQTSTTR